MLWKLHVHEIKHATNYKCLLIQEILKAFLSVLASCNGIFESIPAVIGNAVKFFFRVQLLEAIKLHIIRPHRFFLQVCEHTFSLIWMSPTQWTSLRLLN